MVPKLSDTIPQPGFIRKHSFCAAVVFMSLSCYTLYITHTARRPMNFTNKSVTLEGRGREPLVSSQQCSDWEGAQVSGSVFCSYTTFKYWKVEMRYPWSLLQAEQAQFPQHFFTGEVLLSPSLWPSSGPAPTAPHPFCAGGPRPGHRMDK